MVSLKQVVSILVNHFLVLILLFGHHHVMFHVPIHFLKVLRLVQKVTPLSPVYFEIRIFFYGL